MRRSVSHSQNDRAGKVVCAREGAVTVEFALVLPVIVMFLFGAMEFSRVNQVSTTAAFAAFQGCRQAIITGGTAAGATSAAQGVLNTLSIKGATISVSPSVITPQTVAVTVVVSVPMDTACWIAPTFTKGQVITRACTMTCQDATPANVSLPSFTPIYNPPPPPPPPQPVVTSASPNSGSSNSNGSSSSNNGSTGTTGSSGTGGSTSTSTGSGSSGGSSGTTTPTTSPSGSSSGGGSSSPVSTAPSTPQYSY